MNINYDNCKKCANSVFELLKKETPPSGLAFPAAKLVISNKGPVFALNVFQILEEHEPSKEEIPFKIWRVYLDHFFLSIKTEMISKIRRRDFQNDMRHISDVVRVISGEYRSVIPN